MDHAAMHHMMIRSNRHHIVTLRSKHATSIAMSQPQSDARHEIFCGSSHPRDARDGSGLTLVIATFQPRGRVTFVTLGRSRRELFTRER
jgi:hypothetical protein